MLEFEEDDKEEEEYLDLLDRYSDIILDYDEEYQDQFAEVVV
jgi:hypothetical protein